MSYNTIAFYIAAHHEDRASFRGQQVSTTLADPETKVVFITVTGGGEDDPDRWWEARTPQGLRAAAAEIERSDQPISTDVVQIKGHPLVVYESGNRVSYCLRLPDGAFDGRGEAATRNESLAKLRDWKPIHANDQPCPIHAVDGSTTYRSWQDFCATLAGILSYERKGICQLHPWINAPDYCPARPYADHADHKAVADAVRSFARNEFYNRAWWLAACPANFPTDGPVSSRLAQSRNRFLPYRSNIERVISFRNHADEPGMNEERGRDDPPLRRLVPWYQADLDSPLEARTCP